MSEQGIAQRDQMVFSLALQLGTPVCMLLSGGYAKNNWKVVLGSITNLLSTFSLLKSQSAGEGFGEGKGSADQKGPTEEKGPAEGQGVVAS